MIGTCSVRLHSDISLIRLTTLIKAKDMKHSPEFLNLGIIEPKDCQVCGYGISYKMNDDYVRTDKYIHDCPLCDFYAMKFSHHKEPELLPDLYLN